MAGPLTATMAHKLGVPAGLPVAVASGDHQCSFAGTVADYANTVAVNVGTGGQAALHIEAPLPRGSLELRPYIQRGYLLAGVGAVGGRTFRTLRDFFADAIYALADVQPEPRGPVRAARSISSRGASRCRGRYAPTRCFPGRAAGPMPKPPSAS